MLINLCIMIGHHILNKNYLLNNFQSLSYVSIFKILD